MTVDHVYVPAHKVDAFVQMARDVVQKRYSGKDSTDYTAIIDAKSLRGSRTRWMKRKPPVTVIPLFDGRASGDPANERDTRSWCWMRRMILN